MTEHSIEEIIDSLTEEVKRLKIEILIKGDRIHDLTEKLQKEITELEEMQTESKAKLKDIKEARKQLRKIRWQSFWRKVALAL